VTNSVFKSSSNQPARRYLAAWFPFLPTDRLRLERSSNISVARDEPPLVVVTNIKGALRIVSADQDASRLGLKPGMALADARARVPQLAVVEADAPADDRLLKRLAKLCDRFTPLVALDAPHGLVLDISGCAHLFGGEVKMRARVLARMGQTGVGGRASVASTPEAARALARFSQIEVALPGDEERLVRKLPIAAFAGLEREARVALSRAGFKRIGDVADRPAKVLAARFGQDFITLLSRTLGRESVGITPLRALPIVIAARQFAEPLTQAGALEGLLAELIAEAVIVLEERGQGGRVFEASLFRSDGAVPRLRVETGRPSRDVVMILKLFQERLTALADPIDVGFGFDAIRVGVCVAEALGATQPHLDGENKGEGAIADLVARLSARLGRDKVLAFQPRDTHDPALDARLVCALDNPEIGSAAQRSASARGYLPKWPVAEPGEPPVRPLHLFHPPQPIDTLAGVPDGPPVRFRWRRVLHEIALMEGPERIEPAWWRTASVEPVRDYYRVEDMAGARFWVFRQGLYGQGPEAPRWFLHGVFA
jgi:protein ImuB